MSWVPAASPMISAPVASCSTDMWWRACPGVAIISRDSSSLTATRKPSGATTIRSAGVAVEAPVQGRSRSVDLVGGRHQPRRLGEVPGAALVDDDLGARECGRERAVPPQWSRWMCVKHDPGQIVRPDPELVQLPDQQRRRGFRPRVDDGRPRAVDQIRAGDAAAPPEHGVDQLNSGGDLGHRRLARIALGVWVHMMTDGYGPGKQPAALPPRWSTTVTGSVWESGRAAAAGIRALGARVAGGLRCVGVPTSRASDALGREVGIRIARMRGPVDIALDGADVVTPEGLAIKGGGGALVRERIVDGSAGRFVVLVDGPKVSPSLDAWGALPVAAVPFAADYVALALADLSPTRRPGRSDDGLAIIDLRIPAGADWERVDARARALNGVVDTGLVRVVPADVLVGAPDGTVRTLPEFVGSG